MSELPQGWVTAQISDLSVKCKQRKPDDIEEIIYIDIGSIDREVKKIFSPQILLGKNAPSRARKVVEYRDVLVSLTRPNLNAVALVPEELDGQFASTGFEVIKPVGVENRYIFALVRSQDFINGITKKVQGALYPAAKSIDVRTYKLPLPPLKEQIRIANKLDSLLGKLEATQKHLDKIPSLLKRFRQSVLAAAVSGELIEISDNKNLNLGDVSIVQTGNTPLKSNRSFYKDGTIPWLTSTVTGQQFVTSADKFVTELAVKECRLKVFPKGTLLIAMYGEGKTRGQITEIAIDATINQACAAITVDESLASKSFIKICIENNYEQTRLMAEGGAQPNLNLTKVRAIPVTLPSAKEQSEIVHQVESLFKLTDKVEQQYQTAKQRTNKLTQSILAKAFCGELVPQDPNDEPASELLKRIKKSRV